MNTSLPCFYSMSGYDVNKTVDFYHLLHDGHCSPCLVSTILSVPFNILSMIVIYRSQAKAVAEGKLGDGPIHLIFLGERVFGFFLQLCFASFPSLISLLLSLPFFPFSFTRPPDLSFPYNPIYPLYTPYSLSQLSRTSGCP